MHINLLKHILFLLFLTPFVALGIAQIPSTTEPNYSSTGIPTMIGVTPIIIRDLSETPDIFDDGISLLAIRAAEYSNFLNSVATSDPQNFYNEKMGTDLEAACIVREGSPGDYFYSPILGRENFALTYLSENKLAAFIDWLQNKEHTEEPNSTIFDSVYDQYLSSNMNGFQIAVTKESPMNFLAEVPSKATSIFDYTPGATTRQRASEGIGLWAGFVIGIMGGCALPIEIMTFFFSEPNFGITLLLAVITAAIFSPSFAYLGEKFGKWLAS